MSEVTTVVTAVYDAVNDVNVHIAAGTIERINIKRINEDMSPKITNINNGPNKGKTIKSTHRASILMKKGEDTVWVSFGEHEVKNEKYESQYQIKEGEVWVDLKEGMEIRLPVVLKSWKDRDGNDRTGVEGKKTKIKITDKSGAREPQGRQGSSQQPSGSSAGAGGKTNKVFGDILSVSDTGALVKTETGEVEVVLTSEQLGQISVGGRLAGQRAEDGTLTSFKAYGPKGQGGNSGSSSRSYKKDDLPVRLGNALTITDAMFPNVDLVTQGNIVLQIMGAMDGVKARLREEFKHLDDYAFGARLGQSGILAASAGRDSVETFVGRVEEIFRFVCGCEDEARAASNVPSEQTPEPQLGVKETVTTVETSAPAKTETVKPNGHIDMTPQVIDFDEDIPF